MRKYTDSEREEIIDNAADMSARNGWSARSALEVAKSIFNIKSFFIGLGSLILAALVISTLFSEFYGEIKHDLELKFHTCEEELRPGSATILPLSDKIEFTCGVCGKIGVVSIEPTERIVTSETEMSDGCLGFYVHYETWRWELYGKEYEKKDVRVSSSGEVVHGETYVAEAGYPASCTEDGLSDMLACTICHVVLEFGKVIPAHHDFEIFGAYEPDCKNAGFTGERVCADCGHTELGEEIAPIEHSYRLEGERGASCKNQGYTGDLVCSGCGEIKEYGEYLPTTDHAYVNYGFNSKLGKYMYICVSCGREDPRDE